MKLFKILSKANTDGVFISEVNTGTLTYANEAVCNMLGYSLDELIGREHSELYSAEGRAIISERVKNNKGPKNSGEVFTNLLHKDGRILPVKVTSADRFKDKGVSYRVSYIKDMSHAEKMEEIAFFQSHIVRAPVATALGLVNLLEDERRLDEITRKRVIEGVKTVLLDLDKIIRDVVAKTGV